MDISSILFAAGEGKRLRPLTHVVPKPALPVLDVPLGTWGLAALLEHAAPVVVNGSHLTQELEARLRAVVPDGWELFDEGAEGFGTGGTIAALANRFAERVVVHNGDLVTDLDLERLLDAHVEAGAGITLAVQEVAGAGDFEIAGAQVKRFVDRRKDAGGTAQYLGVAVIEREVAVRIPKTRPLGFGESVLAPLAERGWLSVYLHDGSALDVGTVERYVAANVAALRGDSPRPPIAFPGRVIDVEGGHAYLGPGAKADPGTLGPGAVVLRKGFVGSGAWVENAVVFEKEVVAPGNEVRDGVWIGNRVVSY